MARIVGGSMIGELSGKLGGNVFARNKGGAYIRQYVIPVDPKTQAQISARSSFGSASSSYHALSDLNKANWVDFAQNRYLPKNGANTGQYSGFNAFTALATAVVNAQKRLLTQADITFVGPDITALSTKEFYITQTPPAHSIQSNIVDKTGAIVNLNFDYASVKSNGSFEVNFTLAGSIGPSGIGLPDTLTDGNGNEVGFTFYISNPVQQPHMFISNPELIQVGAIGAPTVAPGLAVGVTAIQVSGNITIADHYKSFPVAGDYVRITAYSISSNGQMIKIGSKTVPVTSI